MIKNIPLFNVTVILFACFAIGISCTNNNSVSLSKDQSATIENEVRLMALHIADDLYKQGPIAWVTYFEKTPQFYMASGGMLAFPNNDSATAFVKNILAKNIKNIQLTWNDMRVDPLTPQLAGLAATYNEVLNGTDGKQILATGYFTAVAEKTAEGWQLRNLHWSIINGK